MQLFKKTNFDFMGKRYYAYGFSAVLLLSGVVSLVLKGGPRLGIDFTGGSLVQIVFTHPLNLGDIRQALSEKGFSNLDLQTLNADRGVIVRVPKGAQAADTVAQEFYGILKARFPDALDADAARAIERAEYVGPAIGRHLRDQAGGAIFWASVLIIGYIGFRFRSFLWGLCSIVAVVHDVVSTVGIFSILNKEMTITVVAGILTLAGYSINDTIVVYDRMRENLRLSRKEDMLSLINRSINETLSRTIITSMSVIFVLFVLYFFGGEVIHDFAFAMLWGVLVGTYSSVFVAAPIIYEFQRKR
jgi:preprotein translocase SecF subunit